MPITDGYTVQGLLRLSPWFMHIYETAKLMAHVLGITYIPEPSLQLSAIT